MLCEQRERESMKVLVISGGIPEEKSPLAGIFAFDQARALMEEGIEVTYFVVDLRSFRHKRKWGIKHFKKDGIQCAQISIPLGGLPLSVRCKAGARALETLFRSFPEFSPDIIHAHFHDVGYMAAHLAERFKIPLVITEHSSVLSTQEIKRAEKRYVIEAYRKADRVVAVSSALAANIKKHTGSDCSIVPNIVDTSLFQFSEERPRNECNIVTVGNLLPIKNQGFLLDAFQLFHKKYPHSHLSIVGDGVLRAQLQDRANFLGLEGDVSFLGQLSRQEISEVFQKCHLFAFTSVSETFGVACIEALASGLPVVTTDCGGPKDFIDDKNGIIVRGNTCGDFADGLCRAYENYERYNRKEISGTIRTAFSPAEIAAQLTELYSLTIDKSKYLEKRK